jgi:hypothetical protein
MLDEKSSSLHCPPPSTSPNKTQPSFTHPSTILAMDCISPYSSLKSPAPRKMNHSAFDESMDTIIGMNDSVPVDIIVDVDPGNYDTMGNNPSNYAPTFGDNAGSQGKGPSCTCLSPRQSYNNVKHMKFKHPFTTKLSPMRSQTSNKTNSTSLLQQEYNVNHSCSTPLEQHAQDVGNTLRQWRVHQGCDWHASLGWAKKMEDVEKELDEEDLDLEDKILDAGEGGIWCLDMTQHVGPPIQCMSMDTCKRGFANRTRRMDKNVILPSSIAVEYDKDSMPLHDLLLGTKHERVRYCNGL